MNNTTLSGNAPRMNGIARFVEVNRNKIVEVISALVILLFLYTALSKSFNINVTIKALKKVSFFSNTAPFVAWSIVIAEYLISLLLFVPKTRKIGLYTSFTLMLCFTVYIGYMLVFVPKLPCSCGGAISQLTWAQHLTFNIFFSLLTFLGILLQRQTKKDL